MKAPSLGTKKILPWTKLYDNEIIYFTSWSN